MQKALVRVVGWLAVAGLVVGAAAGCGPSDGQPDAGRDSSASADPTASTAGVVHRSSGLYMYPRVKGAVLSYHNSLVDTRTTYTVTDVSADAAGERVRVNESTTVGGQTTSVVRSYLTTAAGGLRIDPTAGLASSPGYKLVDRGEDYVVPPIAELEAGKTSTGKTFTKFTINGQAGRVDTTYSIKGVGYRTVSVPAATVQAYGVALTSTSVTSELVGPKIPDVTGTVTYWILPGFGAVKQEHDLSGLILTVDLIASSLPVASA